jgi:prepilin-type N-terminal cleavage/methylation domain-containing protein
MSFAQKNRGFTLIEVLVVVAIIALLISVLLPSLDAARRQGRMVVCQSNLKGLMQGFLTYAAETKGFLPGNSESDYADWLGLSNWNRLTHTLPGRQPDDGTVFKHCGRQRQLYRCPDDDQYRDTKANNDAYSYTTCVMLSGANTANIGLSHYRYAQGAAKNFDETDHTANMVSMQSFVLVEEDYEWYLGGCNNSSWDNDDGITDRHARKRGNVGCLDGHVAALSLSARPHTEGKYFGSRDMCIRYRSKWISGKEWYDEFYAEATGKVSGLPIKSSYRAIERAPAAELAPYSVQHRK